MTATATATPPTSSVRDSLAAQRVRFLVLWTLPIAALAAGSFLPDLFQGGGVFGRVAAGRWMLAHLAVPHVDPLSFTHAGQPWSPHAWLADAIVAGAYGLAGWAGASLLPGLAAGALAALAAAWVSRWCGRNAALGALGVGALFVGPGLGADPLTLALPLMAFWTIGLLQARAAGRAPSLWLIVAMGVWANLDASSIIGLVIAAALALEALLEPRTWSAASLSGWAAFLAASVVAAMATPFGVDSLSFSFGLLDPARLPAAAHWPAPDFFHLGTMELALLAGVFGLFWLGAKLSAVRAAILIGLTHLALQHLRQEALLGVVAPLLVAEPLGRALGRLAPQPVTWRLPTPQMALGAGLVVLVLIARLVMPTPPADSANAPVGALAQVPPALRAQPVINDADFGDYLAFAGVRPFVDGRADMWGPDFLSTDNAIQTAAQPTTDDTLAHDNVVWAILRPDRPLVAALEAEGWRRLYADRFAVVLQNVSAPVAAAAAPTPSQPPPVPAPRSSAGG